MIRFGRRLFPERQYRLPLRWIFWALWVGIIIFLFWVLKVFLK
ncbi:MAG: hypothetical protein WHU95_07335 [candidate division WOR-3 bacterium]|jgi:hypothetical protein|nr:hypothetical protein [candidate division WOR-3 bacterium]MDH7519488.1 hypothetical protein [bacterium]